MQFSIVHDFDVEPAGFWALFFSEAFENELFRGLKMRSWDVFERREEGDKLFRKVKLEPDMSVPSWAAPRASTSPSTSIRIPPHTPGSAASSRPGRPPPGCQPPEHR